MSLYAKYVEKWITAGLLVLLIALTQGLSAAEPASSDRVVSADGAAVCSPTDARSSVRHAAIADALRRAVEKASGVLVEADTSTRNYQLADDSVRTTSEGYVKDYRILDERLDGGVYRVSITAVVASGNPQLALKSLCKRVKENGNPAFLVSVDDPASAKHIAGRLAALGLRVISHTADHSRCIEINGTISSRPLGEAVSGTGLFDSAAHADLQVEESDTGTVLPSIPVSLQKPVTAISQTAADRLAVDSVANLWLDRNLPFVLNALVGGTLSRSVIAPSEQEVSAATEPTYNSNPDNTHPQDIDDSDSTVLPEDLVQTLASKLKSSVQSSREFSRLPLDIAVARFKLIGTSDSDLADNLQEDLSTAMVKTGVFELVERSQLDKVLRELRIQNSGLVDSSTARQLGKLVGAKAVLIGSISDRKDSTVINVRLINTESGRIGIAESVTCSKEPEPFVLRAGPRR